MNLLFDKNISHRIISKVLSNFPNAVQVREVGLEDMSDTDIWQYAKTHGYTIVTFDADFCQMAFIHGHPPKIVWLRVGNTTTDYLADYLIDKKGQIEEFITSKKWKEISCLELN